MSTQRALLQAVIDDPEDDAPRLVFADWLEDNGQPDRSAFIRAGVELARTDEDDPRRPDLVRREQSLLARNPAWRQEVAKALRPRAEFRRGFIAEVDWTARAFLKGAGGLWKRSPVDTVRVGAVEAHWSALLASPHLA